jgi:hypothetical protein
MLESTTAAKRLMMLATTSSSIRVNPRVWAVFEFPVGSSFMDEFKVLSERHARDICSSLLIEVFGLRADRGSGGVGRDNENRRTDAGDGKDDKEHIGLYAILNDPELHQSSGKALRLVRGLVKEGGIERLLFELDVHT